MTDSFIRQAKLLECYGDLFGVGSSVVDVDGDGLDVGHDETR